MSASIEKQTINVNKPKKGGRKRLYEIKDQEYVEMIRKRNKISAKKCREKKRLKQLEFDDRLEQLEKENEKLKKELKDYRNNITANISKMTICIDTIKKLQNENEKLKKNKDDILLDISKNDKYLKEIVTENKNLKTYKETVIPKIANSFKKLEKENNQLRSTIIKYDNKLSSINNDKDVFLQLLIDELDQRDDLFEQYYQHRINPFQLDINSLDIDLFI